MTLVLFRLAEQRFALLLDSVERVIRAVAPTPVPETPEFVLGLINMAGQILPVISLRRWVGLPDRPLWPDDQFMIVRTRHFTLALEVDEVQGLHELDASQAVSVEDSLLGSGCRAQGLAKVDGDIILIYDLEMLLSNEDCARILQAKAIAEI